MTTSVYSQGVIAALVAAVAWGSYTVPLKRIPGMDPFRFQAWLGGGIAASSLVVGVLLGWTSFSWWGVADGLYWTFGAALSFLAVRKEGLAGASARWMGMAILVSFLSGVAILGECVRAGFALAGLVLMLIGLFLGTGAAVSGSFWRGQWRSLCAGLIFGTYFLPLRFSGVSAWEFVAPLGLGIGLGSLFVLVVLKPAPLASASHAWIAAGCGIAWNAASAASFYAVETLGLAVGFPLTQLALLVSMGWGILYFGEANGRRERLRLALAALCLLAGAGFLGIAKL